MAVNNLVSLYYRKLRYSILIRFAKTKLNYMESITLSTQTLQQILNYLVTKPYNEVVTLINTIQVDIQSSKEAENKPE